MLRTLAFICLSLLHFIFIHSETVPPISQEITPLVNYLKTTDVTEFNSGIPSIDCIYVINLDHRTDKWNRLVPIFEEMGVRVNRFSAVLGNTLTEQDKEEMFGPYPISLSGPEIGCLLSHISIIRDAYLRNFDLIWICEDDIEFIEDASIVPEFITNLNKIDPKWDILYTDTNCRDPYDWYYYPMTTNPRPNQALPSFTYLNKRTPVGCDLERIRVRFGTTSMIISRTGIEKILNYFSHVYLWCPYDWDIHYVPGIKEYGITRDAITNLRRGFPGDIHWIPH